MSRYIFRRGRDYPRDPYNGTWAWLQPDGTLGFGDARGPTEDLMRFGHQLPLGPHARARIMLVRLGYAAVVASVNSGVGWFKKNKS